MTLQSSPTLLHSTHLPISKSSFAGPSKNETKTATEQANVLPFTIPRSLHDVDNGQILGYGSELAEGHPGFGDVAYARRRVEMANSAKSHKIGQPIARVEYSEEEQRVWNTVMNELEPLYYRHACSAFLKTYPLFNFSPTSVPQLQDLNEILQRTTGWQIRPTAGLLHPRDFLAGLAFKCFHSTQYMRHYSNPSYTPEPDIIHEALGHVPMLADPDFCDLVHHIGIASLGADNKTIFRLTRAYWYVVEFGVIREQNSSNGSEIKAFGAGILSSFAEMQHMASEKAVFEPFDPYKVEKKKMNYKDGVQKMYFVLNSFEEAAQSMRNYCEHVQQDLSPEVKATVSEILQTI
jgi:phenylalanine-4-hydroxylase